MRLFLRMAPFLFLSILIMGCASGGPKFAEFAPATANLTPDTGRIYMYRTTILGFGVQPEVELNGKAIWKAVPEGFSYVDRKPGTYEVFTSTEVDRKLSLTLESGEMRYVRFDISWGFFVGHVYPILVEPEVGKKEIQDCKYVEFHTTEEKVVQQGEELK